MKLYVASPLGFSEAGREFYEQTLLPLIRSAGHEPIDPWSLIGPRAMDKARAMPPGAKRLTAFRRLNSKIASANAAAIKSCNGLVAVLDGVDIDSGTAAEIGFARAMGKPIVGYRGDFRLSADNEGAVVNLQVEYFIRSSGGGIATTLDELAQMLKKHRRRG